MPVGEPLVSPQKTGKVMSPKTSSQKTSTVMDQGISFQKTGSGKVVGRDTDVEELNLRSPVFREDRSDVESRNVECSGKNDKKMRERILLLACYKYKELKSKLLEDWSITKSKFPDGIQKHVMLMTGLVVFIIFLRLIF